MLALATLLLVQAAPAPGPSPDRPATARVSLSGRIEPRYLYREGGINLAGGLLGGVADPVSGSSNAWTGRFALRLDAEVEDSITGVLELENRSFDEGLNKPLSSEPEDDAINLKLGYIEVRRFLADSLDLRIGVQRLVFQNRPHDEAFFLDLGESEGFFDGFDPVARQMRNSVDRDVREAAGLRLFWAPTEFMTVQAFWALYGEFGGTPKDESVYGVVANSMLSERSSAWLLFTVMSGGDPGLGQVGTLGAGYDGYFGPERELEVFVEGYGQGGTLQEDPSRLRKAAWAGQGGLRGTFGGSWIEAAYSMRSGDRRPGDRRDQAFQSCENENRFLILQSAEFGLDVDGNVQVVRAGAGTGALRISGRPLSLRIDVGRFTAPAAVRLPGGVPLRADDWGIETDFRATWTYNSAYQMWLQAAWLAESAVLAELTGRRDQARAFLFGADLRF
jgi:hypothetical protein